MHSKFKLKLQNSIKINQKRRKAHGRTLTDGRLWESLPILDGAAGAGQPGFERAEIK